MGEARTIYLDACARIAASFTDDGFAYLSSKQSLVRRNGDLTLEIAFQSNPRNFLLAGQDLSAALQRELARQPGGDDLHKFGLVGLIAHATIRSNALKVWRASLRQALRTDDLVVGAQIGNLQAKPEWIQFNLANPHRRNRVIHDVVELIRSVALPYFARFSDSQEVIQGLHDERMPWDLEFGALEYTRCFGPVQQSKSLLQRYLEVRPERMEEYRATIRDYQMNGIPEWCDLKASGRLAKAALISGLEDLGE